MFSLSSCLHWGAANTVYHAKLECHAHASDHCYHYHRSTGVQNEHIPLMKSISGCWNRLIIFIWVTRFQFTDPHLCLCPLAQLDTHTQPCVNLSETNGVRQGGKCSMKAMATSRYTHGEHSTGQHLTAQTILHFHFYYPAVPISQYTHWYFL